MTEILCPVCKIPATKFKIFGEEWIQCKDGHKTVIEPDKVKPPSDAFGTIVLEESPRVRNRL